jgi:predicted amidohydrolase
MSESLEIAVAQPPCVAYDVGANALEHASVVRRAGARVVVFPEMSLTGYELDAPPVSVDDPRLEVVVRACGETGALALAGVPLLGDHIGMLAVDGDGVRVVYRKMWLGGDEPARFVPGDSPAVITVDGWRLGLAICKDGGVAEHAARTIALGVDVYVMSVLEHAVDAAVTDERAARVAEEYQVWVAAASFAGSTGGYPTAAGRSAIWAPGGVEHARAGGEAGEVVRARLRDLRRSA